MSRHTEREASVAITEHMTYIKPTTEAEALDAAQEALSEYIDGALTYDHDILTLWDGTTHEDVYVDRGQDIDIMALITQSTYLRLTEEWANAVFDGIDTYIDANLDHPDRDDLDRDDALAIING